ncbi:MAG: MBL fold metallo-hydrolase [Pseudomonadota bacterium]
MQILDRRTFLSLAGTTAAAVGLPQRALAAPTSAEVFTGDAAGALVDSVVVVGDESALLIDAQINAVNASRLADLIAATGKRLDTVVLTHFHPDHVIGLTTILERFPDARAIAHPEVVPLIEQTGEMFRANMASGAPAGVFPDRVVIPEPYGAETLSFEGETLELLGPLHGDTDFITAVHIPALDTLVGSDLLYADTHVWVRENTTPEAIDKWRASLDQLEALGAGTVVPGHRLEGSANDASTFTQTRAYLDQWEAALESTSSAEDLKAAMMNGNEDLALVFALDSAVATIYPE